MAATILPSKPGAAPPAWSADHLRLHRSLLRQPSLLPRGASLLLAVSGGQDSMAMTGLLRDLRSLHQWQLHLWHGDHGWREESRSQAQELADWARGQGLTLLVDRADGPLATGNREAAARRWRYGCLRHHALRLGCRHVLTAHTATDRAETVLLHLARGSHRRGLASLRSRLPLAAVLEPEQGAGHTPDDTIPPLAGEPREPRCGATGTASPAECAPSGFAPLRSESAAPPTLWLVRPLQIFSRQDTARLCAQQGWPIWWDRGNDQLTFSRNRIRAQVLPVLEALHPGADRRISDQAERLAAELEQQEELLTLALAPLRIGPAVLDRRRLLQLSPASQGLLLQHWLHAQRGEGLTRRSLAALLPRLAMDRGSGGLDLARGWRLHWQGSTLTLLAPPPH